MCTCKCNLVADEHGHSHHDQSQDPRKAPDSNLFASTSLLYLYLRKGSLLNMLCCLTLRAP